MGVRHPRDLVVDACVAFASGGENAVHPTAMNCRNTLLCILKVGHRIVRTPAIQAEWQAPRSSTDSKSRLSSTTIRWMRQMVEKERVLDLDLGEDTALRDQIRETSPSNNFASHLLKDCHLIEAALATHKSVISLETNCRDRFRNVSHAIKQLQEIGWVNPDDEADNAVEWLTNGASTKRCPTLAPGKAP